MTFTSGSDITPCIEINKPIVVYKVLVRLCIDGRNFVAYIFLLFDAQRPCQHAAMVMLGQSVHVTTFFSGQA